MEHSTDPFSSLPPSPGSPDPSRGPNSPASLTSFPLERPAIRPKRRGNRFVGNALPYFITGPENRLAIFVCTGSEDLLQSGNPLLLVGPTGSGKSVLAMHLAAREATRYAVEHSPSGLISATDGPASVTYLPAIDFARQYADAVDNDDLPQLRSEIDLAPVLVIDDIHMINDKPAAQEELASRIETRSFAALVTVVTCRLLPSEIRGMRPALVSRTLPGLTIPVSPPGLQARRLILHELALVHALQITPTLLDLLSAGLEPNLSVRALESAIKQIALWCRMNESAATIDAIQSTIDASGRSGDISLASITSSVARHFKLRSSDLKSSSRRQKNVRARSLAMTLARKLTSKSLHHIGEHFGGRDHSTVLHAIRKTESLLAEDSDLRRAADEVTEKLTG